MAVAATPSSDGARARLPQITADAATVASVLGPPRFSPPGATFGDDDTRHGGATGAGGAAACAELPIGVSLGLVWSESGGGVQARAHLAPSHFTSIVLTRIFFYLFSPLLQRVEASASPPPPGRPPSPMLLTGSLGSVLTESAAVALSWARSKAQRLRLDADPCDDVSAHNTAPHAAARLGSADVHVHLAPGGVSKDGPSAGVALVVSLVSLFSGRHARADTAMTGEISLSGSVLPVGGVREKLLGAAHAGLARVLLPARNAADAAAAAKEEAPECGEAAGGEGAATQPPGVEVVLCSTLEDVLREAFHGGFPGALPPSRL